MRCFLLMTLIVSSLSLPLRATAQDAARAESERSAAESQRSAAESQRSAAESARSAAESKRSGIENASAAAKSAKAAAKSERTSAKSERSAAESQRSATESARSATESKQSGIEDASAAAKSAKAAAESQRISATNERSAAKSAELAVKSLEEARKLAPPAAASPPRPNPWPTRTVSVLPIGDSTSEQTTETRTTGTATEALVASYSFSRAAHFAWLAFDRDEQPLPRDVLTIYEGMTIDVFHGGNYEVRYQVEAPLVETTLRMQLQFRTNSNNKVGTVTLAPVHIHEGRNEDRNVSSQSYQVVQRGHSVALSRAAYHLREDINVIDTLPLPPFTRTGTTRFGAVPQK